MFQARSHLPSLTKQQTGEYVRHRLDVAGANRQIFTAGSIDRIFLASNGVPRLINQICDNALLTAYGQDAHTVDERIVDQVLEQDMSPGSDPMHEEVERVSGQAADRAAPTHSETDKRIEQVYGAKATVPEAVAVEPSLDAAESRRPAARAGWSSA